MLPEKFSERMKEMLGDGYPAFAEALVKENVKGIRVNETKISVEDFLEATELSLSTCILGWFDDLKIREICDLDEPVRLVVALGYCAQDDKLRNKKRKGHDELISYKN